MKVACIRLTEIELQPAELVYSFVDVYSVIRTVAPYKPGLQLVNPVL